MAAMANEGASTDERVVIKKYANRRLYNTSTSSYVTLDHLCQMVKQGTDFVVYDAKSGEDITHSVLTQIIVEEESKGGQNLLPISFLRQLISFYGDSLQTFVPRYLEMSMASFTRNQEQMRSYMKEAFGGLFPFPQFESMAKENAAMFQRALSMFYPFDATRPREGEAGRPQAEGDLANLRSQINALQSQIEELAKKAGK